MSCLTSHRWSVTKIANCETFWPTLIGSSKKKNHSSFFAPRLSLWQLDRRRRCCCYCCCSSVWSFWVIANFFAISLHPGQKIAQPRFLNTAFFAASRNFKVNICEKIFLRMGILDFLYVFFVHFYLGNEGASDKTFFFLSFSSTLSLLDPVGAIKNDGSSSFEGSRNKVGHGKRKEEARQTDTNRKFVRINTGKLITKPVSSSISNQFSGFRKTSVLKIGLGYSMGLW